MVALFHVYTEKVLFSVFFFRECRVTLLLPGSSHSPRSNQSEVLLPHLQGYKHHKSRELWQAMNLVSLKQVASLTYHCLVLEKFLQHGPSSDLMGMTEASLI